MKTIKTIKNLLNFALIAIFLSSCVLDDTALSDDFGDAVNTIGFTKNSEIASIIANGSTLDFSFPVKVEGPQAVNLTTDFNATITLDPSSTAVEGTHFTLGSSTLAFSPGNNHTNLLDLTIISDASMQDTEESIILNVTNPTDSNVLVSGRLGQIVISVKYLCESDLDNGLPYLNPDVPANAGGEATVTEIAAGTYEVSALPFLGWGGVDPIYFSIIDDCGTVSIIGSETAENGYLAEGTGTVYGNGSFDMAYILYNGPAVADGIFFDFSASPSTYTPQ